MFGWPGLAKETSEICKTLHIEDVNETSMSKTEYRRLVTKMLHLENGLFFTIFPAQHLLICHRQAVPPLTR